MLNFTASFRRLSEKPEVFLPVDFNRQFPSKNYQFKQIFIIENLVRNWRLNSIKKITSGFSLNFQIFDICQTDRELSKENFNSKWHLWKISI